MFKRFTGELGKHVAALATGNIVGQAVAFLALPLLARIYGPEAFGLLALYMSASALISVLATGRYEFAIVLPDSSIEAQTIRRLARLLVWTISFAMLIVVVAAEQVIVNFLNMRDYAGWVYTLPLHVALLGELSIQTNWHTREKNFRSLAISRPLFNLTLVSTQIVVGVLFWADFRGLVVGLLLAQIVSWIYLASFRLKGASVPWSYSHLLDAMKRHRKMPLLNAPTALLDGVRTTGVNLGMGTISVAALGQFSMATRVVQVPAGLLGSALTQVYFQEMARTEKTELMKVASRALIITLVAAFPVFLLLFLLLPTLLPLLLGESWVLAGLMAQALTPWLYVNLAAAPISTIFVVTETQGRQAFLGLLYVFAALGAVTSFVDDPLAASWALSVAMMVCLIVFITVALVTAAGYSRR